MTETDFERAAKIAAATLRAQAYLDTFGKRYGANQQAIASSLAAVLAYKTTDAECARIIHAVRTK